MSGSRQAAREAFHAKRILVFAEGRRQMPEIPQKRTNCVELFFTRAFRSAALSLHEPGDRPLPFRPQPCREHADGGDCAAAAARGGAPAMGLDAKGFPDIESLVSEFGRDPDANAVDRFGAAALRFRLRPPNPISFVPSLPDKRFPGSGRNHATRVSPPPAPVARVRRPRW